MPSPFAQLAISLGAEFVFSDQFSGATWVDQSGNGHDATLVDASVQSDEGPSDSIPHAPYFDGVDGHAIVPHDAALSLGSGGSGYYWYCYAMRRVVAGPSLESFATMISKGDTTWMARQNSTTENSIVAETRGGGGGNVGVITANTSPDGLWIFVHIQQELDGSQSRVAKRISGGADFNSNINSAMAVTNSANRTGTVGTNSFDVVIAGQNNTGSNIRRNYRAYMTAVAGGNGYLTAGQIEDLRQAVLADADDEGSTLTGDLVLPSFDVAGGVLVTNLVGGNLSLPALTLAGTIETGDIDPDLELSGDLALPDLQAEGTVAAAADLDGALTLPTLEAAGEVAAHAEVAGDLTLPPLTAAGTLDSSATVSGDLHLPQLTSSGTLEADTELAGALTLPSLRLAGTLTVETEGLVGNLRLPTLNATGTVVADADLAGALTLPPLALAGTVQVDAPPELSGDLALPPLAAAGTLAAAAAVGGQLQLPALGLTGSVQAGDDLALTGVLTLPALDAAAVLAAQASYTAAIDLPALDADAMLAAAAELGGNLVLPEMLAVPPPPPIPIDRVIVVPSLWRPIRGGGHVHIDPVYDSLTRGDGFTLRFPVDTDDDSPAPTWTAVTEATVRGAGLNIDRDAMTGTYDEATGQLLVDVPIGEDDTMQWDEHRTVRVQLRLRAGQPQVVGVAYLTVDALELVSV